MKYAHTQQRANLSVPLSLFLARYRCFASIGDDLCVKDYLPRAMVYTQVYLPRCSSCSYPCATTHGCTDLDREFASKETPPKTSRSAVYNPGGSGGESNRPLGLRKVRSDLVDHDIFDNMTNAKFGASRMNSKVPSSRIF